MMTHTVIMHSGIDSQKRIGTRTLIGGGYHGTVALLVMAGVRGHLEVMTRDEYLVLVWRRTPITSYVALESRTAQCGAGTTNDWRSPNVVDLCRENKTRKGDLVSRNKTKRTVGSGARHHGEMIHRHTTFQGDDKPLTNYHVIE